MPLAKKTLLAIAAITLIGALTLTVVIFANSGNDNAQQAPVRVACIGDSNTEGSGYPSELQKQLGSGYSVRNFGVGGATVMAESGKPYASLYAYQNAKDFRPNVVVIMLGTNDARSSSLLNIDNFIAQYESITNEFQGLASKPKIFLIKPPPIFGDSLGLNNTILVQEIIPRIAQVSNGSGLPIIDVYGALINHPEYFAEDGVHLRSQAAEIIATEVTNGITANSTSTN